MCFIPAHYVLFGSLSSVGVQLALLELAVAGLVHATYDVNHYVTRERFIRLQFAEVGCGNVLPLCGDVLPCLVSGLVLSLSL